MSLGRSASSSTKHAPPPRSPSSSSTAAAIPDNTHGYQPLMTTALSPGEYIVDFDLASGTTYLGLQSTLVLCVTFFFAPCIPCGWYFASRQAASQSCTIDSRRLQYRSGWLTRTERWIPLDRVQDVGIVRPWMCGCVDVANVTVETAGGGGTGDGVGGGPNRAVLVAPRNAVEVRDAIVARRDALVLGGEGLAAQQQVAAAGEEGRIVDAMARLTESIERLECVIERKL
ncbi:hypothetical protein DFJ73DRAFT_797331 [Zopfochytrium polystomum]|nr:hypothetical protein DFJ73DRAFT_797331 [Zopfochytrium polystomum]